jgi:sulfide:quinone oxidoreductase
MDNLFKRLIGMQVTAHSKDFSTTGQIAPDVTADILVIGAGSAGIGVVASLLKRAPDLRITLIEPNDQHYYQPAWTLVGGGAYDVRKTVRPMSQVIPRGATWIKAAVVEVLPDSKRLTLSNGQSVAYQNLIVCPGLRLAWENIEGLEETLGKNGVTSNYRYDLCAYTWQLVQGLRRGKALFSQPAMPIKCAGAPQKALYLSCDHWQKSGVLQDMDVEFNLAGATLFGVAAFVPPLMKYIEKYQAQLVFGSNLVKVDGPGKTAWFESRDEHGTLTRHAKRFDMLHVVPPQVACEFIRSSRLADAAGWCEVDPGTLQHSRYPDVFALGDICSTSNAKTAAAVRKQIVVVAENLLALRRNQPMRLCYDGYGSCPLTVEKGKVVLAEFGYGGKLLPSFPLDPTVARQSAWFLKARFLPWFYWNGMLKGREWLTRLSQTE